MIKPFLPALLWLLFVTGISVMPSVKLPKFDLFSADKLGHAAVYAVLTWLLLRGFARAKGRRANVREVLAIVAFSAFYGVLMEFVQGFLIPGRFYELDDMLANAAGVLAAWLLHWLTSRKLAHS